jgi:pyruvate/2-oxoglutarate dehydrogenase complex dihydrolipoamide dehydrogenase (E3) component/uncharacterized membrane protein YdjX (TVP38/TMEM64 family)
MKTPLKLVLLAILIGAIVLAWQQGWLALFTLENLKAQLDGLRASIAAAPVLSIAIFFALYVIATALSLPAAGLLTLAAGALFGLYVGTLLASFASTAGATLAFLASRFLFRDAIEARFGARLQPLHAGIEKDGARYLFALRLIPAVPFFLINLGMGLTRLKTWTFVWVSQLGMLIGTIVYVNAGTQLARLDSTKGLLSPALIGSLLLLALLPFFLKGVSQWWANRQRYAMFKRPKNFDRNLIVIGAGAGGLVTSYIAAAVKAKVTLIERGHMGGDCLNYGCVPSKALIRSARLAHEVKHGAHFGIHGTGSVEFGRVMARVHEVIGDIAPHDSVERYEGLGVEVRRGVATLVDPFTVEINGERLTAPNLVIAAGARPSIPPIPGLAAQQPLTSETLWELTELPQRLLILGAGPIGCELAQAFARLGSRVTLIEAGARILPREDPDVVAALEPKLRADGVEIHLNTQIERFEPNLAQASGGRFEFDRVLCATGRRANSEGLNLDALGIELNPNGTIKTDEFLRTTLPNVFAVGDIAGPYQFTHAAAHQAWYAAVHALFGRFKRFKVDYRFLPWATFTAPEIARVGLNESDARAQGIAYEMTRYGIDDLDRAICDGAAEGFVKVLTVPGRDQILGVTIVSEHAAELIAEFVLAMKHGLGLNKILGTIHLYPSWTEANKYAAGQWKRAHQPEGLLRWVARYHAWMRG